MARQSRNAIRETSFYIPIDSNYAALMVAQVFLRLIFF